MQQLSELANTHKQRKVFLTAQFHWSPACRHTKALEALSPGPLDHLNEVLPPMIGYKSRPLPTPSTWPKRATSKRPGGRLQCKKLIKEGFGIWPMTPRESVSLNNHNLYILVNVNRNKLQALVDSRATVAVINVDHVKDANISDEHIEVKGYDGEKLVYWKWAEIIIYQKNHAKVNALMRQNVAYWYWYLVFIACPKHCEGYQLLLPWPLIEQLCLNIYWTGEVSIDKAQVFRDAQPTPERALRKHKSAKDVTQMYRELECLGDFPEMTTAIEVPFKLRVIMVVMRKPYNMSRGRKVWPKSELQKMLDAKKKTHLLQVSHHQLLLFRKRMGRFICTRITGLSANKHLFSSPMPRIEAIIDETGGCKMFSRIDLCKGFWQVSLQEEYKYTPLWLHSTYTSAAGCSSRGKILQSCFSKWWIGSWSTS